MRNNNFENRLTKTKVMSKNIFDIEKYPGGEVIIFLEIFKTLNLLS